MHYVRAQQVLKGNGLHGKEEVIGGWILEEKGLSRGLSDGSERLAVWLSLSACLIPAMG